MIFNRQDYRNKVLGCWMGKNIGGTLGAPMEWRRQINDVSFYTQELGGEPLPNDDLDIQLLWLIALEEKGVEIDAKLLSEYWVLYVTPHWCEYGTGKINMRSGLVPPLSGTFNNDYKDSCGAFIRSEIWACIAPGCPQRAAQYAYEDAILDHGNGEGTFAEVFCAALESAAFVESDVYKLIDIGLSYIPVDCGVAQAVRCAIECYRSGKTWQEARDEVLTHYRGSSAFNLPQQTSPEDHAKGFAEGKQGWDVPSNIGMLLIGLLYGEGDFDRSMCIAVNCGEDTDCTGATVGSIFGIIHGFDAIPQRWIEPIGHKIKTACLNLGELGYFGAQLPANIDNLTDRTERVARQVLLRYNLPVEIAENQPTDLSDVTGDSLMAGDFPTSLYFSMNGPIYRFDFFDVAVDYGDSPAVWDDTPKTVRLKVRNTYKVQENLNIHWYTPDNWRVRPSRDGKIFAPFVGLKNNGVTEVDFTVETERVEGPLVRFVVEFTVTGRPTAMLVPVTLVNGNLMAKPEVKPE